MVNVVIVSHGSFAPGIYDSLSMLFGEQNHIKTVSLLQSDSLDDIRSKMLKTIASFEDQENILIFTDLKGGTPYNVAKKLVEGHESSWALLAGMNLPMLLTALIYSTGRSSAQEVAIDALKSGREGISIYPEELDIE